MKIQHYRKYFIPILPILLWVAISEFFKIPEIYLPKIQTVIITLWSIKFDLLVHTWSTLEKIITSLVLGTTLGILLPLFLLKNKGRR